MYYTVFLVLNDLEHEAAILDGWEKTGVTGITIINSTGLGHIRQRSSLRDDVPLMPSLHSLLHAGEEHHRTFMSVVDGDELVDRIIAATQAVLGDMTAPDTGILFVMPVTRVVGVPRRGHNL
jgi:nitrogen regulatory protein P-II 1